MGLVTVTNKQRMTHEVTVDGHAFLSDEPGPEWDDEGPDAHELMLAALGSCQAITLRMYCERKGWQLGNVTVSLTSERLPDGTELIESHMTATGDLDEDQRKRLEEIMGRCPISKLLKGTPQMVETLELSR